MTKRSTTWFQLPWEAMQLAIESQSVIALRMMKFAAGGAKAEAEASRMVAEKIQATLDVHGDIAKSVLAGEAHLAPGRAMDMVRRQVSANRKRLSKGD